MEFTCGDPEYDFVCADILLVLVKSVVFRQIRDIGFAEIHDIGGQCQVFALLDVIFDGIKLLYCEVEGSRSWTPSYAF